MPTTITMETEASHMLEAALEQMDDIIAGSKAAALELTNGMHDLDSVVSSGPLQVIQLAVDLKLALELQPNQEDRERLRAQLPIETAEALKDWLQSGDVNLCPPANNETYQERLLRLEGDKESLVLQVSVLTDQVEAQGEKIRELESSLEEHRQKLASTEEMLQQELVSRTSLETQKLDLMDEVSYLKLKLVSIEETHHTHLQEPMDANQNKAECVVNLISELQEQMCRFQEEISTRIQEKRALEDGDAQRGGEPGAEQARAHSPVLSLSATNLSLYGLATNDLLQEVKQLKNKVEELEGEKGQYERQLRVTKLSISYSLHVCYQSLMTQLSSLKLTVGHTQLEKQQWEERWRSAQAEISDLQQLLCSKDVEIESLQTQLLARGSTANDNAAREEVYIKHLINKYQEYQRLKVGMESLLASNDEKTRRIEELTSLLGQYRKINELMALTHGSSEEELSGSVKVRAITQKPHCDIYRSEMSSRGSSPLMLSSSSPYQRELDSWHQRRLQSSSLEELQSRSLQKPVETRPDESESDIGGENAHMELNKYQTLPGKLCRKGELRTKLNDAREIDEEYLSPGRLSPVHSHDQDYSLIRYRSASAPILGSPGKYDLYYTECSENLEECILSDQSPLSSGMDSPIALENRKSQRGIKKLWGLIRRSQSGSPGQMHDPELGDFKRRGPRMRRSRSGNIRDLKMHFSKWNTEQVCEWLEDIGLRQYAAMAHQWISSGQTLLSATAHDLEKEMGMKNPLHRKKLHLAIKTFNSKQHEKSAELDYLWVTRWLDDIGLPQYKDQFNEGRVDGQMLQYLTVNDLLALKVTSQLHHLSIKCAIHVLHVNQFNPYCLKRRPGTENQCSPREVIHWSNHRVMEWLRSVDLAEYAPNLRGSGVHGGLIMLEPRFNSDSLAMLLNIPPQKTLLRRHLATNFSNLVGAQAQQEKREYTEAVNYTPLSITAKVKPKKLGFSNLTHLRRRRPDESTDYVCPIESAGPLEGHSTGNDTQAHHYNNNNVRGLSTITDRKPDHSSHQPSIPQPASHPHPVLLNPQPSPSV
ncbi:liprin-beta-2b isoform X4 [Hippocampus zosterae]|uniref:liprin-beta-2b isoform X4 n=1 Tax=Hippocampus zosterae TaxID=109293 RepID=UPI00223DCC44|nr:liprin-beta-2b isoform X4 [Hippocampus zosterae]